jgi:hypothetical protein
VFTKTVKDGFMEIYSTILLVVDRQPQILDTGTGKIKHAAAAAAYKMGVGLYISVKTFFAVYNPHGYDASLFPKQVDITVYRSQGKIGNQGLELVIHPLCTGM